MEQGVYEGDVILLRFKFMAFFDMNAKVRERERSIKQSLPNIMSFQYDPT